VESVGALGEGGVATVEFLVSFEWTLECSFFGGYASDDLLEDHHTSSQNNS